MKSSRLLLSVGSGLFLLACGGDASLGKNATDVAGEKTGGSVTGAGGAPGTTSGRGPARRRALTGGMGVGGAPSSTTGGSMRVGGAPSSTTGSSMGVGGAPSSTTGSSTGVGGAPSSTTGAGGSSRAVREAAREPEAPRAQVHMRRVCQSPLSGGGHLRRRPQRQLHSSEGGRRLRRHLSVRRARRLQRRDPLGLVPVGMRVRGRCRDMQSRQGLSAVR